MERLGEIGQNCEAPPPSCNSAGSAGVKWNQVCWASNPTTDVLPGEPPRSSLSAAAPQSSTFHPAAAAPAAHSVVLYLLLSVRRRPQSLGAVLLRHPDTELQMGAAGPRRLVSQRGLEFTVGIKYETNMSLYICFPPFVHPAVSSLSPPPARSPPTRDVNLANADGGLVSWWVQRRFIKAFCLF